MATDEDQLHPLEVALPQAWAAPSAANDCPGAPSAERGPTAGRSRSIRSLGYDAASRVLRIEWASGNVYEFDDVPAAIHEALAAAGSPGKYFQDWIRDRFAFRRLA